MSNEKLEELHKLRQHFQSRLDKDLKYLMLSKGKQKEFRKKLYIKSTNPPDLSSIKAFFSQRFLLEKTVSASIKDKLKFLSTEFDLFIEGHTGPLLHLATSIDNKTIASSSEDKTFRIWDLETRKQKSYFCPSKTWVNSVKFVDHTNYLISSENDSAVNIWDCELKTVALLLCGHKAGVKCSQISRDCKYLVTGSWDKTVRLWDLEKMLQKCDYTKVDPRYVNDMSEFAFVGHEDDVLSVDISHDNKLIASGGDDYSLKIWSLEDRALKMEFEGHRDKILCIAFTKNSEFVLSSGWDKDIFVWSILNNRKDEPLKKHRSYVSTLVFSRDFKYLVSASGDKSVIVWDFDSRQPYHEFFGHTRGVTAAAITPDNRFVISGAEDMTVRVWNVEDKKPEFVFGGHTERIKEINITEDYKFALSITKNTAYYWDVDKKSVLLEIADSSVKLSPDFYYVIYSVNNNVLFWNTLTRSIENFNINHQDQVIRIELSKNKKFLLTSSGATTRVWDLKKILNSMWLYRT